MPTDATRQRAEKAPSRYDPTMPDLHKVCTVSLCRFRTRMRGAVFAVAVLCLPMSAQATWDSSSEIVGGSAQVLEKGEIAIGFFAPLQYGLTDRMTIASHPVLDLLQMVNFSGRYRIRTEDQWILSATGGFKYALLDAETTDQPFEMDVGAIFTWLPHRRFAGSLTLTYSPQIQLSGASSITAIAGSVEAGEQEFQNGVAMIATGHFIVHEKHLVMATLRLLRNTTLQDWEPTLTVAWVSHHSAFLGGVDVVLGASVGRFRIRDPVIFATASGSSVAESAWYPVFDIWKHF